MLSRKNKLLLVIAVIVILIGRICMAAVLQPRIWGHIYMGDHISADVSVLLDGKEISPESINTECFFEGQACSISEKDGTYKTRGGEYGRYQFRFSIPEQTSVKTSGCQIIPDLALNFINSDSWHISVSKVIVSLHTESNGKITGYAEVTTVYNDGTVKHIVSDLEESKGMLVINWGL